MKEQLLAYLESLSAIELLDHLWGKQNLIDEYVSNLTTEEIAEEILQCNIDVSWI